MTYRPYETYEDVYDDYKRFAKKGNYKRACHCLEEILHTFPEDIEILQSIVELCLFLWENTRAARKWLRKLARLRSEWLDYAQLGRVEAELENIEQAKKCLKKAKELQKRQRQIKGSLTHKTIFSDLENYIQFKEQQLFDKASGWKPEFDPSFQLKQSTKLQEKKKETLTEEPKNKACFTSPSVDVQIPFQNISVKVNSFNKEMFSSFTKNKSTLKDCRLLFDYTYLTIQRGFDELLCLNAITNIEKYWYQVEVVKKVLRYFHGRALLCDEVGLGKTIEAGMLIKEYCLRGMAKNILILTPPALVSQWKEEMNTKFGMQFITTEDMKLIKDPASFWKNRFIIASIHTAKQSKNMSVITEQFYDILVVDEAHHLRNRTALTWKLVNQIKKKFIFLLSATPVQNNLIELFNLITLLKPGEFKTEKLFKQEYIQKGNVRAPANKEKLRELLRNVMIRNTRSAIDLKLPKRFATTMQLEPTEMEKKIYNDINNYLRKYDFKKPMFNLLLREAGSSPFALKNTLLKMNLKNGIEDIIADIDSLGDICKAVALTTILLKNQDEKKIIFTQFLKSVDYIVDLLERHNIPCVTFKGDMSTGEKDRAIERFKNEIPVLVSTETGGEGRNMQFCNTIINFDLPWNPMKIEQRIGRLHRIGQKRDVFIFNLSVKGTIEDYIVDILDNKINMFQMVIGEIEPILGYIGEDKDFETIIIELWLKSSTAEKLKETFQQFGDKLINAKKEYLKAKSFDEEIFGEDYEA